MRALILLVFAFAPLVFPDPVTAATDETICSDHNTPPEVALDACNKLIASGRHAGTDLANIVFWRGYAHDRQNATDAALADYSEAIRLDPANAAAYDGRARLLVATGQRERAIEDWSALVKLDPKNPTSYINRGALLYLGGDLDGAIADFDAALALDPNHPNAFNNRGAAWRDKGDLDRAFAESRPRNRLAAGFWARLPQSRACLGEEG
jgi:tetratricopeptide (TPR) repeat protein